MQPASILSYLCGVKKTTRNFIMVKKTFLSRVLLTLAGLAAMACSSDEAAQVKAQPTSEAGRTLVVYYSYTGDCRDIVTALTSQIEADVLE